MILPKRIIITIDDLRRLEREERNELLRIIHRIERNRIQRDIDPYDGYRW